MTDPHTSAPLHVFASGHVSGIFPHENEHVASQPVFGPFPAPKSHCSIPSTTPSPHTGSAQAPCLQRPFAPHAVPSFAGSVWDAHV
jgi:hypothetical protein